ncbi:MAG: hypothetical protein ACI90V_010511 [Bacillariaceae sp.]|jgi:hypothetical protein
MVPHLCHSYHPQYTKEILYWYIHTYRMQHSLLLWQLLRHSYLLHSSRPWQQLLIVIKVHLLKEKEEVGFEKAETNVSNIVTQ